ncbi:MAG TPA: glycosyltransferase, partial [Blastocatellia bacterium]|nr:glycosyltransferase [Blastocatellia bacterium]
LIRRRERTYAGAARNAGVRASRGRYVVMVDSDCVLSGDAVERMVRRPEGGEYAAVGGSVGNGTPRSLSGTVGFLIEFREFMPSAPFRVEKGIPTANIIYRREVFERFGYFDEDIWPAEDILFNWRLYEAGERLLFDPEIRAVHLNRTGWRNVLSHQLKLGATSALARKRGRLSGGVLLRFPALIIFMPIYRLMKAARWFFAHDRKVFLFFLAAWPLYLFAACFWSWGFMREALKSRR